MKGLRYSMWNMMRQTCSHLLRLDEFELHAAAGPGDEVTIGRVVQQSDQELPELQGTSALVGRSVTEHSGLLLDLAWMYRRRR